mmetsp:Transcript_173248/g.555662  ORF Transcript_173248/g.555662 Transcript_173248/m.555662 type:complete len:413 (+) Transcript_173248:2057-3295(+)
MVPARRQLDSPLLANAPREGVTLDQGVFQGCEDGTVPVEGAAVHGGRRHVALPTVTEAVASVTESFARVAQPTACRWQGPVVREAHPQLRICAVPFPRLFGSNVQLLLGHVHEQPVQHPQVVPAKGRQRPQAAVDQVGVRNPLQHFHDEAVREQVLQGPRQLELPRLLELQAQCLVVVLDHDRRADGQVLHRLVGLEGVQHVVNRRGSSQQVPARPREPHEEGAPAHGRRARAVVVEAEERAPVHPENVRVAVAGLAPDLHHAAQAAASRYVGDEAMLHGWDVAILLDRRAHQRHDRGVVCAGSGALPLAAKAGVRELAAGLEVAPEILEASMAPEGYNLVQGVFHQWLLNRGIDWVDRPAEVADEPATKRLQIPRTSVPVWIVQALQLFVAPELLVADLAAQRGDAGIAEA